MDKRTMLINAVMGEAMTPRYNIVFSVDCMGNITIWQGSERSDNSDFFVNYLPVDSYLHLHPAGRKLREMEREAAKNVSRADLVGAYLSFRSRHTFDGWLFASEISQDLREYRDDIEEVIADIKRRNRQYMKDLFGVDLPVDFDFLKYYNETKRL